MAKKKKNRQLAAEQPKSQALPASKPAGRTTATSAKGQPWLWWAISGALLLIVGLIIAAAFFQQSGSNNASAVTSMGQVASCRAVPRFASAQGFQSVTFNSDDLYITGLKMVDGSNPQRVYKHPSWARSGLLGPVLADGQGNIYTGPVPRISLIVTPPQAQNRV